MSNINFLITLNQKKKFNTLGFILVYHFIKLYILGRFAANNSNYIYDFQDYNNLLQYFKMNC